MNLTSAESLHPTGESPFASRKRRWIHLALMVFELVSESLRFQVGRNHEFEDLEESGLIEALRVCASYACKITYRDFDDCLVVQVEGIDHHLYMMRLSLHGPGIVLQVARVKVTSVSLFDSQEISTSHTFEVMPEFSRRLKLDGESADRAFLSGMSFIIGMMEEPENDEDEEARLAPLIARVMPTSDELRAHRAHSTPSSVTDDDEGDQPF